MGLNARTILPVLVFLLALAAFSPSLNAEFIYDDTAVQNFQLPNIKSFADAVSPPKDIPEWAYIYYRPVVTASYLVEDRLNDALLGKPGEGKWAREARERARLPHAVNLTLHGLNSLMLYLLARKLLPGGYLPALAAGALFAAHPIHAESVIVIAGRSDLFAAFFLLAGFLAALSHRKNPRVGTACLAGGLFLLAFLSKEVALAGLALLPLLFWVDEGPKKTDPVLYGFAGGAFAVYLAMRFGLNASAETSAPFVGGEFLVFLKMIAYYLREAVFPWPVDFYAEELPSTALALAILALCCLFAYGVFRWSGEQKKLSLFFAALFFLTLAPSFAPLFFDITPTPNAGRYLYLPSVGFCFFCGLAAMKLVEKGRDKPVAGILAALVLVFGASSFSTALDWRTNLGIWSRVMEDARFLSDPLPVTNYAGALLKQGRMDEAERTYYKVLDLGTGIPPKYTSFALNSLGELAAQKAEKLYFANNMGASISELMRARSFFDQAYAMEPDNWWFSRNTAWVRFMLAHVTYEAGQSGYREFIKEARARINSTYRLKGDNSKLADVEQKLREMERALL